MQASCPKKSPHDKALCLAGGVLSGVLRRCTAAAMLLLTAFPISAFAAEHLSLWPLRGHLYVVEDEFYTKENSMVYVGEKSVTVIGATWTPDTAKQLVIEIRKISDAPITQVINTNYHTDRAGGNAYFKAIGAEIVATEMTREQMARGWDEIVQFTRSSFPNYPALPLVLPDKTYTSDFTLQDGRIRGIVPLAVTHPFFTKPLLKLPFLTPNEELDERQMHRGDQERAWVRRLMRQSGAH